MPIRLTVTGTFTQLDPEKQQRIMEAAISEFAERGYNAASMNTVVGKAGISKGALFKYFQSKKGLFGYVYRAALHQVKAYLRTVSEATKSDDFFMRLEKIMRSGVTFIEEHPRLARIYYHSIRSEDSPYKKEMLRELHEESLKFIRSLIEEGIERGELREDLNPHMAALLLESVLDRFLQLHQEPSLGPAISDVTLPATSSEDWVREVIDLFRDGWSGGPCAA